MAQDIEEQIVDVAARAIEAYKPLLELCTEAQKLGFALNINIGPDAFGRFQIQDFQVVKVYK